MANTKHVKVEFGQIVHSPKKEIQHSTQGIRQENVEIIKIVQKGKDENTFYGYRKVNYTDQKIQEAHIKINKMLGGN